MSPMLHILRFCNPVSSIVLFSFYELDPPSSCSWQLISETELYTFARTPCMGDQPIILTIKCVKFQEIRLRKYFFIWIPNIKYIFSLSSKLSSVTACRLHVFSAFHSYQSRNKIRSTWATSHMLQLAPAFVYNHSAICHSVHNKLQFFGTYVVLLFQIPDKEPWTHMRFRNNKTDVIFNVDRLLSGN